MTRLLGIALACLAAASASGAGLAAPATVESRPRGAVEDCSTTLGRGRRDEFTSRWNLIVEPLAIERAGHVLGYAEIVGENKLWVHVKGGHRATLELSRRTRTDGLKFGPHVGGSVPTRRVVTFTACRGDELSGRSAWVGFLLASSPQCVPLRIWIDDELRPRRAVIRFGVQSCS